MNRVNVLNIIRTDGPISKADIANRVQVSSTTVATILTRLMEEKYVKEEGIGKSTGGRKPILYQFNPDKSHIIAVSLQNTSIQLAILNLAGEPKKECVYEVHHLKGASYVQRFMKLLSDFVHSVGDLSKCIGISIVCPGIIDAAHGVILYNAKLELYNVELGMKVERAFGLQTYLENDINALAMAEQQFGQISFKEMIYLSINEGVGSGIIIDDHIFRGYGGSAGEIGHMTVVPGGITCSCGNQGCLENYVSWPAIYARILSGWFMQKKESSIFKKADHLPEKIVPLHFVEAACEGDRFTLEIVHEMAEYVAVAITNVLHFLNPQAIMINGEHVLHNQPFFRLLKEKVHSKAMNIVTKDHVIRQTTLGRNQMLLGALAILLQNEMQVGKYDIFLQR